VRDVAYTRACSRIQHASAQLCYAFRRWNDIDTARDIYRNATLEKLTFLQRLNEREVAFRKAEEVSQLLLRDILDGVAVFRSTTTESQSALQDLLQRASADLDQRALALTDVIGVVLTTAERDQMEAISRVDSALGEALYLHSTSLNLVATTIGQSLRGEIEELMGAVGQHITGLREGAVGNDLMHATNSDLSAGRSLRAALPCGR